MSRITNETPHIVGIMSGRMGNKMPCSLTAMIVEGEDGTPARIGLTLRLSYDESFFMFDLAGWNETQRLIEAAVRAWPQEKQPPLFQPGAYADSEERKYLADELGWACQERDQVYDTLTKVTKERDLIREELAEMKKRYKSVNDILNSLIALNAEEMDRGSYG